MIEKRAEKSIARSDSGEEAMIPHPVERLGGVAELLQVRVGLEERVEDVGSGVAEAIGVEDGVEEIGAGG